ncbi:baseplate J protein [Phage vB_KsaM-C1]|nr:baseplate J protein [Phage vB_KsaM-C1]
MFFLQQYFSPDTVDDGYADSSSTAPSRIYAQYRNKPKAVAWYKIAVSLATQLSDVAEAVRVVYNVDSAQGEQLDIIGRIVVMPRDFIGFVSLNPGMFALTDGSEFGDESAMFSALTIDQDDKMSDDLYRLAIKSKIIKNNSSSTIEDVLMGMNFLLPNADVLRVIDGEDMSFSVEFYGNITELERWALLNAQLVPKPQGVRFNGFLEGKDYVESGDSDKQFGDTNSQFTGFIGV